MKLVMAAVVSLLCFSLLSGCGAKLSQVPVKGTGVLSASDEGDRTVSGLDAAASDSAGSAEKKSKKLEKTTKEITEKVTETEPMRKAVDFEKIKSETAVVGDSIALGYSAYQRLPSENVFAALNVSPSNIEKKTFEYRGGQYSINSIIKERQPKYILISMGLNEINSYSAEKFSGQYKGLIDSFLDLSPESKIYVMALSPVESSVNYISNGDIDEYNRALSEMADNYDGNVSFVNAAKALKDSNGALLPEYSGGDGIHLSGAAYDVLLDGLKEYMELGGE